MKILGANLLVCTFVPPFSFHAVWSDIKPSKNELESCFKVHTLDIWYQLFLVFLSFLRHQFIYYGRGGNVHFAAYLLHEREIVRQATPKRLNRHLFIMRKIVIRSNSISALLTYGSDRHRHITDKRRPCWEKHRIKMLFHCWSFRRNETFKVYLGLTSECILLKLIDWPQVLRPITFEDDAIR